jgi:hypothetical protein
VNAPVPDPALSACHIDESAGMDPAVNPPAHAASIPTTPCDVCGVAFEPGHRWWYHARLGVYVHPFCATHSPVRGEDITEHTMIWGKVPTGLEVASPSPRCFCGDAHLSGTCMSVDGREALRTAPATGGIVDPSTPHGGTEGTECLIPLGQGAISLGDKLRHIAATEETVLGGYVVDLLAYRADELERERYEAKERARLAVEQCRHLHQDGLTREEWHRRHCGAVQPLQDVGEFVAEIDTDILHDGSYAEILRAEFGALRRQLDEARAQVERVRALHRHGPDHLCTECQGQYPCPTYLAVGGTQ